MAAAVSETTNGHHHQDDVVTREEDDAAPNGQELCTTKQEECTTNGDDESTNGWKENHEIVMAQLKNEVKKNHKLGPVLINAEAKVTNGQTNGHLNVNEETNGHTNGHVNGESHEQMNGHVNGEANDHLNGEPNGHVNGESNGQPNGHIHGEPHGQTNGHVHGEPNNGQANGHANGELKPQTNGHVNDHANGQQTGQTNGHHANGQVHDQASYFKAKVLSEIKNRDKFFSEPQNGGGVLNRETVIQREIRVQREREETLARERQVAQLAAQMQPSPAKQPIAVTAPPKKATKAPIANTGVWNKESATSKSFSESVIAREIMELKVREDELQQMRNRRGSSENLLDCRLSSETCLSDLHPPVALIGADSSSHDGSNSSLRTESPDSAGSGPSVLDFVSHRKVTVRPLMDEDEKPIAYQILKESPIEREIRQGREREEDLRRAKGLSPVTDCHPQQQANGKPLYSPSGVQSVRSRALDMLNLKGHRDVQRKLATSRIQQEIEEQTAREHALRAAGTIKTTSEDHIDGKVLTRLGEFQLSPKFPLASPPSLPSTPDSESTDPGTQSPTFSQSTASVKSFNSLPKSNPGRLFVKATNATQSLSRRPLPAPAKGVMQKFIASRGKVIPSFTSSTREKSNSTSSLLADNSMSVREQLMSEIRAPPPRNCRRTYCSAESKIQTELQQMKAREEEHRLTQAKQLAMSQPNLLSIDDDDDDVSCNGKDHHFNYSGLMLRDRSSSNPNLLDDSAFADANDDAQQVAPAKVPVGRRRSALIAQWEEKIQQNNTDN